MPPRDARISYPTGPSIQMIPTVGPEVYQHCLQWASWILRLSFLTRVAYRDDAGPLRV